MKAKYFEIWIFFFFDPEKYYYEPKKTVSAFNNNYIHYESMGNKDKNLLIKEYLDMIRPYLSDIINDHKTQVEWRIHSDNTIIKQKKLKVNGKFK